MTRSAESSTRAEAVAAELDALASWLTTRREAILDRWRVAGEVANGGDVASTLSRVQFNDHIPVVLDCLAHTIREWTERDGDPDRPEPPRVCEHGLQRWQQGYALREVVREWGHLQLCVADELERYAEENPGVDAVVMRTARRAWTQLCADGVTESATQYWRLHQTESAGHVTELEQALEAVRVVDRARAEAWRTAAHDLRGSVTVVRGAAELLDDGDDLTEPVRTEIADLLSRSVSSLHDMLTDLLDLARLEAGHERRDVAPFDAADLLRDFCTALQPAAAARGLYLKATGPQNLPVAGDRVKVLRIAQNLLLNAMKYTPTGGISVSWGADQTRGTNRWTFSVQDTGPGLTGDAAPLAQTLLDATVLANDTRKASTDRRREISPMATLATASAVLPLAQQPGEGVGLTIVKRLCELLDASLELATAEGQGATFRVILPCSYEMLAEVVS